MNLNGQQIGEFTAILRASFSRSDFTILLRTELDLVLDDLVPEDDGWKTAAYKLIEIVNQEGRIIKLIRAVRNARPNNTMLIAFCDPLLAEKNGAEGPTPGDALRTAAKAYNRGFNDRYVLFNYITAYKALHDVLHELQSFLPKIEASVAERKADPTRPLEDDVVSFLEDNKRIACESVTEIEFPDKPPSWIGRLVTAANIIIGPDVEKMPREVERLRALPSEGLRPLNDKLYENASRLQPTELIRSLSNILAAIGKDTDPAMDKLRGEVEDFRGRCTELHELTKAHNLCQKIDDALNEAAGLKSVTTDDLSDWDVAKKSLDELVLQRKNDLRVQRTAEAARSFESANQLQEFRKLVARFDDLFTETDRALLKVTNKLPTKALALNELLEKSL